MNSFNPFRLDPTCVTHSEGVHVIHIILINEIAHMQPFARLALESAQRIQCHFLVVVTPRREWRRLKQFQYSACVYCSLQSWGRRFIPLLHADVGPPQGSHRRRIMEHSSHTVITYTVSAFRFL